MSYIPEYGTDTNRCERKEKKKRKKTMSDPYEILGVQKNTSKDDIKMRLADLERALKLGNLEHNKIKIVFEDTDGVKQVETTVWGVTDKRVILKQGIMIPIHRIYEIR